MVTACLWDQSARRAAVLLAAALGFAAGPALAINFPVTGTLTVNGSPGALPDGGTFGDSTYNPATGALSVGKFTLPQGTVSFASQLGQIVVTYQLSQINTSTGQVDTAGIAALTQATMQLAVLSATLGGIPISVGTCVFEPIDLFLVGTGSVAGLDVTDPAFTIPSVEATDCGGYGAQINAAVAGSNNAIALHLAGDFTPPAGDPDFVFEDGFE